MVKYQLLSAIGQSRLSCLQACRILGLAPDRFYRWRALYREFGPAGLVDKPPAARCVSNRLLPEEEAAIFRYANGHPQHHHREIKVNLEKEDVYISATTIYRRLKQKRLIREHKPLKPRKRWVRPEATAVHQHWLVDLTYILIGKGFWYLIAIIDLYSRYVVGWELSAGSTAQDVQRVIDFTLAEWGFHEKQTKPVIHSDNGPQMKAKSLKKFLKYLGVLNEYSRPHIPQDLAVLERLFRTTKQEEVYRQEYANHLQARDSLSGFFDYYNHRRPHQSIGNVTPYDRLTGRDVDIIRMRKINSELAQQRRKSVNHMCRIYSDPKENNITPKVYTKDSEIFLERV